LKKELSDNDTALTAYAVEQRGASACFVNRWVASLIDMAVGGASYRRFDRCIGTFPITLGAKNQVR
jgi:hypothetical protein